MRNAYLAVYAIAMTGWQVEKSADELMRLAREMTEIDLVDSSIEDALVRLHWSINNEGLLNERGAVAIERRLLRLLCNRLRMQRDFAAHPEISTYAIVRPVFLSGGPRTGSTKLHKLLASSGDFLFLPFWRGHCLSLRTGDRREDPAPRIEEADEYVQWVAKYAPQAQSSHAYGTFEPEEEALILEHFIVSCFPNVFVDVPTYVAWWARQDFTAQAQFLKQGLQYLQWQFHEGDTRPWVLKCPIYPGLEAALAQVFPDAVFVTTNRNPISTVASSAHLMQGYRQSCSDADQRLKLGKEFLDGLAYGVSRQLALRNERPDLRFLDVGFSELNHSSESVIKKIYIHAGMHLSDRSRGRMHDWASTHGYDSYAGGRYVPADFGLTAEMITVKFHDYIERFGNSF